MKTNFVVQTNSFEGPLDTLLSLIETRKLYINDISLAKVTADYIKFIANNQETIANKTEFVSIASTLILAKSKSLLPDKNTDDSQEEINELEDRLRAYKLTKESGKKLSDKFGVRQLFSPDSNKALHTNKNLFAPGDNLDKDSLATKAKQAIISLPQDSLPTASIEKTVSLEEAIDKLKERCRRVDSLCFSSLSQSKNRRDHVVLFVAVLELIKSGSIKASQPDTFAEITIQSS